MYELKPNGKIYNKGIWTYSEMMDGRFVDDDEEGCQTIMYEEDLIKYGYKLIK